MPMFNNPPPALPVAPPIYDPVYINHVNNILRMFFNNINAVQGLNMAAINLDLSSLPTDADFNILRVGDVYRDTKDATQPGSQALRIKTSSNVVILSGISATGRVGTPTV